MSGPLAEAWAWYEGVKSLARTVDRLGQKHWDALPWEGPLGRDEHLRELTSEALISQSAAAAANLDDLCVLLLFSVFEAVVRERVLEDIAGEIPEARHPALQRALSALHEAIGQGSFFRVLEPYKGMDAGLVEQVNQVRRYRNWVAHGRRGSPPGTVTPRAAYDRLQRFLDRIAEAESRP